MIPVIDGKRPILVRAERERAIQGRRGIRGQGKSEDYHRRSTRAGFDGRSFSPSHGIPVVLGKTLTLPRERG